MTIRIVFAVLGAAFVRQLVIQGRSGDPVATASLFSFASICFGIALPWRRFVASIPPPPNARLAFPTKFLGWVGAFISSLALGYGHPFVGIAFAVLPLAATALWWGARGALVVWTVLGLALVALGLYQAVVLGPSAWTAIRVSSDAEPNQPYFALLEIVFLPTLGLTILVGLYELRRARRLSPPSIAAAH